MSTMKLLVLIVITSSAYCLAGSEDVTKLDDLLKANMEIRENIASVLDNVGREIKKYPQMYNDVYNETLQFANENFKLDFLTSEDSDNLLVSEYGLLRSHKKHYEDKRKQLDEEMVKFIHFQK